MSSVTLEKTVGSMNSPFRPSGFPPHSSLAPSEIPLWISSKILLYCFLSVFKTERKAIYANYKAVEIKKVKMLQIIFLIYFKDVYMKEDHRYTWNIGLFP